MTNRRYELTDEQWERVKGLIIHSKMERPPEDDRIILNAMVWMVRSGAGWEDLPNGMARGKQYTAASVNVEMTVLSSVYLQSWGKMQIGRIFRWIQPV